MKFRLTLSLFALLPLLLAAQKPAKPTSADIHQALKKLNVLGSVLYVAAHPDDENQRFISYMANERLFNVTYLSLTRGDGGQNLIGPELRELLGVLRTEELLMARSVDGGRQRFSRANDFGFSKNPEETMRIWNKDEVLADVVWQFRECRPDVVVNRFYHDKKYDTHGHHTASAMLSVEAFDLAGSRDAFPEQLKNTEAWQPRRLFFNTSWWFFGGRDKFDAMDKSHLYPLDLGVFLPLKGKSNNELAAEARSMHRCQGFGSMGTRGESVDYFDFIKGEKPAGRDLFEGINTTWSRVPGGEPIGKLLAGVEQKFRHDDPAASVPDLLTALYMMKRLPDSYWKRTKLAELKEVIRHCLGLYLEASAAEAAVTPGASVKVKLEAINRSQKVPVTLVGANILPALFDTIWAKNLEYNKGFQFEKIVQVPENVPFTAPYWLLEPYSLGMYTVPEQAMRGIPETPRAVRVRWQVTVGDEPIEYETDVIFKKEESAIGEVYQPFEVLPPVFVEFGEQAYLFNERTKDVTLRVKANKENLTGKVRLTVPKGWSVAPAEAAVALKRKGEEMAFTFQVTAPAAAENATLGAEVEVGGKAHRLRMTPIIYDHIPQQSVLLPAQVQAARLDVRTTAKNIGYVMGAGDEVPAALRQIGCKVTLLELENMGDLSKYDAIVVGIRAYNTKDALKFEHQKLLDYVQNGGTLVVQYNTNFELVLDQIAPFPLKISRTRVTDEAAEMRFLLPEHAALNTPNKLTAKDFEGWVQERGLYFPSEWDTANFAAPLSCNDPGEKPADGSLLVAQHGKGWFVYTGLSFFRELPTGVPGAMRLFANLISLGKRA